MKNFFKFWNSEIFKPFLIRNTDPVLCEKQDIVEKSYKNNLLYKKYTSMCATKNIQYNTKSR